MFRLASASLCALMFSTAAAGAVCSGAISTTIKGYGEAGTDYQGAIKVLNDCVYPYDGSSREVNTIYGFATTGYFDYKFTKATSVGSFSLTADGDDDYTLSFYDTLSSGTPTVTRTVAGARGQTTVGLKTYASDPTRSGTYVASLALAVPVTAAYVRVTASRGDGRFAIGEAEFYVPSAAAPEPTSWALMIVGFGTIGSAARRRRVLRTIAQA